MWSLKVRVDPRLSMCSKPSFGHYWSQLGCISPSKCVGSGNMLFWAISAHSSRFPPMRSKPSFGHFWSRSGCISPSKCVGSENMQFWVISTHSSTFPPMRWKPSFGHYLSQLGCILPSKCVGSLMWGSIQDSNVITKSGGRSKTLMWSLKVGVDVTL